MQEVFENIIKKLESLEKVFIKWNSQNVAAGIIKAIEIVKQEAEQYEECYKYCRDCEAYNKEKHHCPKFCKVIKETVKEIEDNHNGWIPCSEQLPDYGESVLVSFNQARQPLIATFYGNDTWKMLQGVNGLIDITNEVIAWQPLPQPYQPKGE